MVDLFFIKTFVTVAKTGSFRVAAERNFISQPAVSGHIRTLEKKFHCRLFERQGKKISLTNSGQVFLKYAEQLLRTYEEAKIQVDLTNNRSSGTIRIATIYSIGLHELKPFLKGFLKKYPQIHIHLEYRHSQEIYEDILKREIDFGLIAYPKNQKGITAETIARDNLVVVQSSHNRTFKKRQLRLVDLNHTNYVGLAINSPTGETVRNFLSSKKIYPKIIHEYDNIETMKSVAEMGMGYSIVPRNTIAQELKSKTLEILKVPQFKLQRPIALIYPTGKILSRAAAIFYKEIVKGLKRSLR